MDRYVNRSIEQIESTEIESHKYSQLISDNSAKVTEWVKYSHFNNGAETTC